MKILIIFAKIKHWKSLLLSSIIKLLIVVVKGTLIIFS